MVFKGKHKKYLQLVAYLQAVTHHFYFMGSFVDTQQVRGIFHCFDHIFNRLNEHTSHPKNIGFTITFHCRLFKNNEVVIIIIIINKS